jgi:hypothetical protein
MRSNQRLDQGLITARFQGWHGRAIRRHDQLPAAPALQAHRDAHGKGVAVKPRL